MSAVIPASRFKRDGDTAWWVTSDPIASSEGWAVTIDRPCDTCDGLGKRFIDSYGKVWGNTLAQALDLSESIPCPACHGTGRHLFPVEAASTKRLCKWWKPDGCVLTDCRWNDCPTECSSTLTVSVVPGMILRVVSMSEACSDSPPSMPYVLAPVGGDGRTVIVGHPTDELETVVHLPAVKPGEFVVKLLIHETAA